jgi:hypothetical protein
MTPDEKTREADRIKGLLAERRKEWDRLNERGSRAADQAGVGRSIEELKRRLKELTGEEYNWTV